MFDRDMTRFAALMTNISEVYNKTFTSAVLEIYWSILRAFSYEEVAKAIKSHLTNPDVGKYLPKPSDIIMAIDGNTHNQALRAWTKVLLAIKQKGAYASIAFDDALIHAVIGDMEGWQKLCAIEDKYLPFVAKEFQERYRGYVVNKPLEYPKYLIGAIESKNKVEGFNFPKPELLGDAHKAQQVINGGRALDYQSNRQLPFKNSM